MHRVQGTDLGNTPLGQETIKQRVHGTAVCIAGFRKVIEYRGSGERNMQIRVQEYVTHRVQRSGMCYAQRAGVRGR